MPKKRKKQHGSAVHRKQASKSLHKKQSVLSKALSESGGAKRVREAYFTQLSPKNICTSLHRVERHPFFLPIIDLTSKGIIKNFYHPIAPPTKIASSASWIVAILLHHKDKLNKFCRLEKLLSTAILLEKHDESIALLDEIDLLCGISTWSIGLRGSVLKASGLQAAAQDFLTRTLSDGKDTHLFPVIARHIMNRADDSSMFISSSISLRKQLLRNFQGGLRDILIYKLVPRDFSFEHKVDYASILNFEKNASIIDAYKALLNFAASSIDSEHQEIKTAVKDSLEKLVEHINSTILDGLASCHGIERLWTHNENAIRLVDFYSAGRYADVFTAVKPPPFTPSFTEFEVIAKAATRNGCSPFEGLLGELLADLKIVLTKKSGYQKALSRLLTISHSYCEIPWFQELHFLISRESSYVDRESDSLLAALSEAYSEVNTPRKVLHLPESLRDRYLQSCRTAVGSSLSLELLDVMHTKNLSRLDGPEFTELVAERCQKYRAIMLIEMGDTNASVNILEQLVNSDDQLISYDATILLTGAYIDIGRTEEAIDLFVNASLRNINVARQFDTQRICKAARDAIEGSSSTSVPIALSLHSRLIDNRFDSTLRYAFEKFLLNRCVQHPLEIAPPHPGALDTRTTYFLEHVCTQDVMKLSLLFKDKKDIEDCRVSICSRLIDAGISKEHLAGEIKEITKEQVIREAVTHVDHSRIYADTSSFRDSRSAAYRNAFERFLELKQADYSDCPDEQELAKVYEVLPRDLIVTGASSVHLLDLTLNDKNMTFHKLVSMLRDEFTFGEKGLNGYLGTRIRHGLLPDTIRTAASKEQLLTTATTGTKKLSSNDYWRKELAWLPDDEWRHVDKALGTFTEGYEAVIAEINDEWLQIASLDQDMKNMQEGGGKAKALLDYSISALETYALQRELSEDSYENFARMITSWLWRRTSQNLEVVKKEIRSTAVLKFRALYSALVAAIDASVDASEKVAVLRDAIGRSRDSLSTTLDAIPSWFTRAESQEITEFSFGTAIEIAARSANITTDVKHEVNVTFKGEHLTSFVDVLYVLFENAASKSRLPREQLRVTVELNLEPENGNLILRVTNNCEKEEDIAKANQAIDYYRDAYGNDRVIREVVQKLGGSGLFRIWRCLSKDIGIDHTIEFGYEQTDEFAVTINMKEPTGVICHANSAS